MPNEYINNEKHTNIAIRIGSACNHCGHLPCINWFLLHPQANTYQIVSLYNCIQLRYGPIFSPRDSAKHSFVSGYCENSVHRFFAFIHSVRKGVALVLLEGWNLNRDLINRLFFMNQNISKGNVEFGDYYWHCFLH